MIKVENIVVTGFEAAVRSARNPLNSWAKSDSSGCFNMGDCPEHCPYSKGEDECTGIVNPFIIGPNDLDLLKRLANAGDPSHRKYLRFIHVSMDIIAPVYWDAEFDTYKVGVTRNSCSLMHKGTSRDYILEDFSIIDPDEEDEKWIEKINKIKNKYLETKDPKYFLMMRQRIPMGYNYRFTVDMNYENVFNMIHQRENHRLPEWREFVEILKTLPYVKEIGGLE